jgi:hypothetical protein
MNLNDLAARKSKSEIDKILCDLIGSYMRPVFGALPKREIDLIFLQSLEDLGGISKNPQLFEIIRNLKVTRTKARSLHYEKGLRQMDLNDLEKAATETLKRPILQKQGALFVLQIEDPLVSDYLRNECQKLGHATDSSFSPSLMKLSIDAYVALIERRLSKEDQRVVEKALVEAGAPDVSFKGVVRSVLVNLGKRAVGEAGQSIAEGLSDFITALLKPTHRRVHDAYANLSA